MKLTEDEIACVEKLLSNFEKGTRTSREHRWRQRIGIVVLVAVAVMFFWYSYRILNLRAAHQKVWMNDPPSGREIESYVKVQNVITGGWLMTFGLGILALSRVTHVLIEILQARHGRTRKVLIARILRAKWEEEKAAIRTSSSSPVEDLGAP